MENWKEIPGFEGEYVVSDSGSVRSLKTSRVMVPGRQNGYFRVTLSSQGKMVNLAVHRLVLITFRGINLKKQIVHHINGNTADNRLENLEWVTSSENSRYAYRELGHRVPQRLNAAQVLEIKKLLPSLSQIKIGKMYGVSGMTISKIARGKTWISV